MLLIAAPLFPRRGQPGGWLAHDRDVRLQLMTVPNTQIVGSTFISMLGRLYRKIPASCEQPVSTVSGQHVFP